MPDPTNEFTEAADYLENFPKFFPVQSTEQDDSGSFVVKNSRMATCIGPKDRERLHAIAALLRKVGPLVERAKRIERGCRYDDRCGNCQAVIDLRQALAAFSPEPNREHDAAAERTRVAES